MRPELVCTSTSDHVRARWASIPPRPLPRARARAYVYVSYGRGGNPEGRGEGVQGGEGQNEREAEVITEREPLVAPGACVQIDHPLPRAILPVSPFLEHGPRGITVGFQRVGTLVSRNVNAAPSCRDTLEVGSSSAPRQVASRTFATFT